jgi:hypothetical protein
MVKKGFTKIVLVGRGANFFEIYFPFVWKKDQIKMCSKIFDAPCTVEKILLV